jgi:tetratricopeptide (TPR) repeat protein
MRSFNGRVASFAAVALFAFAGALFPSDLPWNGAPLSADPKALLAAAEKVSAGEAGAVVLLDEARYSFDAQGHAVSTRRLVARIIADSAVDDWSTVEAGWSPWFQEKPQIEARVVSKDGTVHTLEAKAITETAAQDDLDIFSDNRIVRAPLPGIAAGSVLEQVVTYTHKTPIADAGLTDRFIFGRGVPLQQSRLIVEAPSSLEIHIANRSDAKQQKTEENGRQRLIWETGPLPAVENYEYYLPYDMSALPYVAFSTGRSWQEVARRYAEIVEQQIKDAGIESEVKAAVGNATDRREVIARILASIQKNVRYAGVEVGEGSIIPRAPREVLSHKYGDCKDKASLLVAMLRVAKIQAHVALLRSGHDLDVQPDLPGLGEFNHAIVIVDGEPAMWIDPTDEFARANEMPAPDQGRNALVASDTTTSLTQVPMSESPANRYLETRSFTLVEEGKSTVVEVSEAIGAEESGLRRGYSTADRKQYREMIERYVEDVYAAKKLKTIDANDAHDLAKPFQLRIEAAEASRGISIDGEAGVAIYPAGLMSALPWPLRDFPDDSSDSDAAKTEAARKKRTRDFVFPSPSVREWNYKIVPPPGFIARELPATESVKIGSATLSQEYKLAPEGIVLATLKFDSGKRRLTATEFEEMRKAVHDYRKSVFVGFDDAGKAKLNAGDVAGALEQYRKMVALHPNEARHHSDIARALVAGGLGESARAEARRAVQIEPKSAPAQRALAFVLQHDLIGRPYRKGFDLPGALAAYRKAKELDSKDLNIRVELAKLYEYGDDGTLFGKGAKLNEAIAEYRAISTDLKDDRFENELVAALARSGRFAELREFAKTAKDSAQRELAKIVAAAGLEGSAAALKEAGTLDASSRRERVGGAAQLLLPLRLYSVAADLYEEAVKGSADSTKTRTFVDILRKTKQREQIEVPENAPRGVVMHAMFDGMESVETQKKWITEDERNIADDEESEAKAAQARLSMKGSFLSPDVLIDIGLAAMQFQQDGDDKSGYRIRSRVPAGVGAQLNDAFFVVREKDRYAISASDKEPHLVGWSVLRFVDAGDAESGRKWLNWARENVTRASGDDPLAGPPFAVLWPKDKPTATLDEVRLAAASLMVRKSVSAKSEPILLAAREKATTDEVRNAIDSALLGIYAVREDSAKALQVSQRLAAALPSSPTAFNFLVSALVRAGKSEEATNVAKARLEKMPKDIDAIRGLAEVAMSSGDFNASEKYYRQVIDELSPTDSDYNSVAWTALFTARNFEKAIEDARRATDNGTDNSPALHTLAALYAETGKTLEAREMLMKRLDVAGREEPNSDDWYVLGRIAESYGVRDAALAAYKRVEKPKVDLSGSSYQLAQHRLSAMK